VAAAAWGGTAAGQAPKLAGPAATDGRPAGHVIVLKETGKPDTRVQVLRSWRGPDGKVVTEVKDLGTGTVFTMTDLNPGGDLDAPPRAVPPKPAAAPMPAGPMKPSEQMRAELEPCVEALTGHARPSARMDAATALADGRYAGRKEVKQVLATAAAGDPAGVVRAHCIGCLSKLGHADPDHVRKLHAWSADKDPTVRQAAQAALAKLAPKN
jgi:hypothetical protein